MANFFKYLKKNLDSWLSLLINLIITSPIFEVIFSICCILIKIIFLLNTNNYLFLIHNLAIHDTGNMFALLLYLEHIFISYYLIIIIIMVYWALFPFISDFAGWSINYNSLIFIYDNILINNIYLFFYQIYFYIRNFILVCIFFIKELEILFYIYHINFVLDDSITVYEDLYSHYINKYSFSFYFKYFDMLGRSTLIINQSVLNLLLMVNILIEFIFLHEIKDLYNILLNKKLYKILFTKNIDAYFYSRNKDINIYFAKTNYIKLNYSYFVTNLRYLYKDMFLINQFKHSGIFEAIWAIVPSIIILAILVPSLILLYSFENVINPGMTIKVIGNQWYWKYELNYYANVLALNNDRNIYGNIEKNLNNSCINFCFDSKIINITDLNLGNKRLLEVDNRLVLPTNVTIRFLVSPTDVLHSFAMPGLGFKIDANPGRLNQIITYINRPGVYYGQCSELCGANHGFMPIVFQCLPPSEYYYYLSKLSKIINI